MLASGRGDELASDDMTHAMRELLLPQTHDPHAEQHRGAPPRRAREDDDEPALGRVRGALIAAGCGHVLITGYARGDAAGRQHALRQERRRAQRFSGRGFPERYHGSGCTLASAIAAMLANGLDAAGGRARGAGLHLADAGRGVSARHGPVSCPDRLFWAREEADARCGRRRAPRVANARGSH